MTVYSKTNAGRLLAFEPRSATLPAVRDLLRRVDGKTTYQELISRPGDAEIFQDLLKRQLVQIATEPWRNSAVVADSSLSAQAHPAPAVNHRVDSNLGPALEPRAVNTSTRLEDTSKIDTIKTMMCGFVQTHLPGHVKATFAEINALTNEAQLLCMLTGYVNLINPTGAAGLHHVQLLLLILADSDDESLHTTNQSGLSR